MAPEVLYHYTSFAAFQSIIKSRSLWSTHVRYLNDSLEFSHAFSLAENYIDSQLHGTTDLGSALTQVFGQGPLTACVASFSEEPDSLSQWRAYSQGGAGVCIGFRAERFQRIIDSHQPSSEQLVKCIYEEEEKQRAINELLEEPVRTFVGRQKQTTKEELAAVLADLIIPVVLNAPRFKHIAFKDEKEWRFVRHSVERHGTGLKATPWQFRACGSYMVPYTPIDLSELEPLEIDEVVVGPNPHSDDAIRSTEMFLAMSGVRCRSVRCSRAPFRFW